MAHHPNGKSIIEPDKLRLKAAKLPPATTERWVIRRKAQSSPLFARCAFT